MRRFGSLCLAGILACASAGLARAQVINGESTADSAYAPRPAARWSPPSGRPQPSAIDPQDDDEPSAAEEAHRRD